jgi:hypothetical protein
MSDYRGLCKLQRPQCNAWKQTTKQTSNDASLCCWQISCIKAVMHIVCLEYERLRESYESTVKSWVQTMLSFDAALVGLASTHARQRRQKALKERNVADDLMTAHELVCPQCKRKTWKVIPGTPKQASQIPS